MGYRPPPFDGGSPRQVTLTPHKKCDAMHCAKDAAMAIARHHRARYETYITFVLDQIPHPSYEGEVEVTA